MSIKGEYKREYLTRQQIAEQYPISAAKLAALANDPRGPRFYKPVDKALYRRDEFEAWIESAVVQPGADAGIQHRGRGRRGNAISTSPKKPAVSRRLKSLTPSKHSSLLQSGGDE